MSGCPNARAAAIVGALTIAMAGVGVAPGCGGKKSAKGGTALLTGETLTVGGTLSLRGSTPFPELVLERDDGGIVLIQSSSIQDELKALSGMRVSVRGDVLESVADTPVLDATSYELLRLDSGELPIVGIITMETPHCILTTRDGKRYWVRGDLRGVIRDYEGAKIWIIGSLGDAAMPDRPKNSVPFWVTGYGVLDQQ